MSQRLFRTYRVLWMDPAGTPSTFEAAAEPLCCDDMRAALTNACEEHAGDPFACGDQLVSHSPTFGEFGLIVHDGGASSVLIRFCPWCGSKLPESRRDAWFDEIEKRGLEPHAETLPDTMKGAAWRQSKR